MKVGHLISILKPHKLTRKKAFCRALQRWTKGSWLYNKERSHSTHSSENNRGPSGYQVVDEKRNTLFTQLSVALRNTTITTPKGLVEDQQPKFPKIE